MTKLFSIFAVASLVLFSCSKSSDDNIDGLGNDSDNLTPKSYDTTGNVYQRLINQFKGDNGSIIIQNENNVVTFAIDFTPSKNGRISNLRANTGYNGTYTVSLWRVGVSSDSTMPYKTTTVQTNNTQSWSGDKSVDGWEVKKDSTYRIGIRVHTKVNRLHSVHNINNASGVIGDLKFGKTFYYNTQQDINLLPKDVGTYLHFAGFLDFDFISYNY